MYLQWCLDVTLQVPHKTAAISAHLLCTPQNCVYSFIRSHIHRVHGCLAVTYHLHFWQNDWWSFTHYCSNTEMELVPKSENWPWKEIFPCRSMQMKPWPRTVETSFAWLSGYFKRRVPLYCVLCNEAWVNRKGTLWLNNTAEWKTFHTYLRSLQEPKLSIKIFKVFLYTHVKCK